MQVTNGWVFVGLVLKEKSETVTSTAVSHFLALSLIPHLEAPSMLFLTNKGFIETAGPVSFTVSFGADSASPFLQPCLSPVNKPSVVPTNKPTMHLSTKPTMKPSISPSVFPTPCVNEESWKTWEEGTDCETIEIIYSQLDIDLCTSLSTYNCLGKSVNEAKEVVILRHRIYRTTEQMQTSNLCYLGKM